MSPESIASDVCAKEIAFATSLNKRFAPIVVRPTEVRAIPAELQRLNFVFFTNEAEFDRGVTQLVDALTTDIAWVRRHTEMTKSARAWDSAGRPRGLLLRSPALDEAERWIGSRPRGAPVPPASVNDLVSASRKSATNRLRWAIGGSLAAAAVAITLAGLAWWQRAEAVRQEAAAVRQKAIVDDRFTRLSVATGTRLLDAGDVPGAQLWFANPLSIRPLDEAVHRTRVAATAALYPRLVQLLPHDAPIDTVLVDAAGDRALTRAKDDLVRIWDLRKGTLLYTLPKDVRKVMAVALAPDGQTFATASPSPDDKPRSEVRLLDATTGAVRDTALVNEAGVAIWAMPGNVFVVTGQSGSAGPLLVNARNVTTSSVIWRPGKTPAIQRIGEAKFGELTVGADGKTFLASVYSGRWNLFGTDGAVIAGGQHDGGISGTLSAIALCPTGLLLATADTNGKVFLWDTKTGTVVGEPLDHGRAAVRAMAFSPDGRWLATTGGLLEAKTVRVWNVVTGKELFRHDLPEPGYEVAFSPSGRYLLSVSRQGTLEGAAQIWDVGTGLAVTPPIGSVFTAKWAADGRTIVTAGTDKTVKVWDVFNGDTLLSLDQQELVRTARFSGDGQVVVAEVGPELVRLSIDRFDRPTFPKQVTARSRFDRAAFTLDAAGSVSVQVREHESSAFDRENRPLPPITHQDADEWLNMAYVSSVEFDSGGRTVLVAGGSTSNHPGIGHILVWDALTGHARTPTLKHDGYVEAARFSPDGTRSSRRAATARRGSGRWVPDHPFTCWNTWTALPTLSSTAPAAGSPPPRRMAGSACGTRRAVRLRDPSCGTKAPSASSGSALTMRRC